MNRCAVICVRLKQLSHKMFCKGSHCQHLTKMGNQVNHLSSGVEVNNHVRTHTRMLLMQKSQKGHKVTLMHLLIKVKSSVKHLTLWLFNHMRCIWHWAVAHHLWSHLGKLFWIGFELFKVGFNHWFKDKVVEHWRNRFLKVFPTHGLKLGNVLIQNWLEIH